MKKTECAIYLTWMSEGQSEILLWQVKGHFSERGEIAAPTKRWKRHKNCNITDRKSESFSMVKSNLKKIGRFQILHRLGEGAQGIVYLAADPYLQRQVAIKVFRAQSRRAKELQGNFLREARTVSKMQHPNIVPIFEAGEHQGIPYLVFQYVDGISLMELIGKKNLLTVSRAIVIMRQILDGVGCAHKQRIIHRDLTPTNILVSKGGVPRVMDFGISQMIGTDKTTGQDLRGTPQYMSPEHFSEMPIGPGSDVFALGLIFFEMLTHTPAITGNNQFNTIYKIINEPTVAPSLLNPEVDEGLDGIVLKAARKDYNARFPDVHSMKEALDDYIAVKKRGLHTHSGDKYTHSTVDFMLRRMRLKADFPTFSECVMKINKMTSTTSNATAIQLANVILRDYSLTKKLLKLVNSSFYGQFGGNITSIYKAVVILGFEQVRLASSSLMLFTHLHDNSATEEVRDAMIKSFMSGIIAKDLTNRARIKRAEIAFICSMFHDLGRNLIIYYFPEEYAEIKKLMSRNGYDIQSAARSVLGVSLDEIGVSIARVWKFPETIVYCMRGLPDGTVEKPNAILDNLRHFSVFANELCGLASSVLPENRGESLSRLVNRFKRSFSISETEVLTLFQSAIDKVLKYAEIVDIDPERSHFIQKLLKFMNPDDESCNRESQSPHSSEFGRAEGLPVKNGESGIKDKHRTREPDGISKTAFVAYPIRFWKEFLKLTHKLGLMR